MDLVFMRTPSACVFSGLPRLAWATWRMPASTSSSISFHRVVPPTEGAGRRRHPGLRLTPHGRHGHLRPAASSPARDLSRRTRSSRLSAHRGRTLPTRDAGRRRRPGRRRSPRGRPGRLRPAASSPARDPAQSPRLAARASSGGPKSLRAPRCGPGEVAPAPVPAIRGGDARGRHPGGGHLRRGAPRPSPVRRRGHLRQEGRSLLAPRCGLRLSARLGPGCCSCQGTRHPRPQRSEHRLH